ncbi:NF-kappa-B inhibitor-interacting Ras-like protein 1 isoform X1 [Python bivittatus]|uniref:NF-kappa-B inhibitor-interacting Ras-like protein 1 isoform X1 n=1 Tax=Python bivittatus TaxID=176946 RepID=A0A9F2QVW2_PYTBI|nr:NF-kappa-B inhibitor-interacting Ras-like protein 1 isoform X1 [Python bivittatus]
MGKGFKVVVCGMSSVGKTAILEQVLYGNHSVGEECSRTIEDVYVAVAETDRGLKEQLRLYDTRGLQGGEEFPKHYYSIADGFVLVYAVNSLESFEKVDWLKKEIDKFREKKEGSIIVLGNKTDLLEERQVRSEVAQQWARFEKVKLWEVTVTDGRTLMEPFMVLASKLCQSQNKSTFPLPGRKLKGNNEDG